MLEQNVLVIKLQINIDSKFGLKTNIFDLRPIVFRITDSF